MADTYMVTMSEILQMKYLDEDRVSKAYGPEHMIRVRYDALIEAWKTAQKLKVAAAAAAAAAGTRS